MAADLSSLTDDDLVLLGWQYEQELGSLRSTAMLGDVYQECDRRGIDRSLWHRQTGRRVRSNDE